jgi:hypothetical protein
VGDLLRVALAQYPSGRDCIGIIAQAKAVAADRGLPGDAFERLCPFRSG